MTALEALLRAVGLEVVGGQGLEAEGLPPAVRDADNNRWVLAVVPPGPGQELVRARADLLAGVGHPHLATIGPRVDLADGSLAVLQGDVPGTDLAALHLARGAWSPGEVVTVVVPLAEALAALHDTGLAHGDVAPGNVVLTPEGRSVLVGAVDAAAAGAAGTPGLAAPERPAGATSPSDVYALGRLGALLLAGGDAVGGEGLAALLAELTEACALDPAHRPSARTLARRVYAACPPAAVAVPDAAVLARLSLRQPAMSDVPPGVRGAHCAPVIHQRARAGDRRTPAVPIEPVGSHGGGVARRGRHRARRGIGSRLLVTAVGGVLVAVGCGAVLAGRSGPATPGAEVGSMGVGTASSASMDSVATAIRLTRARAAALGDGDPARLALLTVPGSAAWRADRRVAPLIAAGDPPGEAVVRIVEVAPVGPPRCGGPTAWQDAARSAVGAPDASTATCVPVVRVAVVSEAQVVSDTTGGPATSHSAVVLVLRPTAAGWRVSEVEPYGP